MSLKKQRNNVVNPVLVVLPAGHTCGIREYIVSIGTARYVSAVVDSVEFESGIKLNDEEQQQVYRLVEEIITRATSKGGAA